MNPTLKRWLAHYLFGLATSCWNAGISAAKLNGGMALAAAAAPKVLSAPDLRTMLEIFAAAAVYEALDYFADNKLPTELPAQPSAPAA